jgi:hypothetical protein
LPIAPLSSPLHLLAAAMTRTPTSSNVPVPLWEPASHSDKRVKERRKKEKRKKETKKKQKKKKSPTSLYDQSESLHTRFPSFPQSPDGWGAPPPPSPDCLISIWRDSHETREPKQKDTQRRSWHATSKDFPLNLLEAPRGSQLLTTTREKRYSGNP